MELPKIYTEAKVSPAGKVNAADLKKILRDTAIFLAAPAMVYLGQLNGTLSENHVVLLPDLIPSLVTIGGIEVWLLGTVINFFLKLSDGSK